MDTITRLNTEILNQEFGDNHSADCELISLYRQAARIYSMTESAIAVLSDMKTNSSYIYYGDFARQLGIDTSSDSNRIGSIWEDDILVRIHPDDLRDKYLLELKFFRNYRRTPSLRRSRQYLCHRLRMKDTSGNYIHAIHRMFYIQSPDSDSIRLALCLYNPATPEFPGSSAVIDSATGQITNSIIVSDKNILSKRESQVLRLIDNGMTSKSIASMLSISIHTVSRHRQELLSKLQVRNSIEACRLARKLGLI